MMPDKALVVGYIRPNRSIMMRCCGSSLDAMTPMSERWNCNITKLYRRKNSASRLFWGSFAMSERQSRAAAGENYCIFIRRVIVFLVVVCYFMLREKKSDVNEERTNGISQSSEWR